MVHLRIVVPARGTDAVLTTLLGNRSVCNVARFPGAAVQPAGDVILADVAPEDASLVVDDLKALGVHKDGSISVESVESILSDAAAAAVRHAPGSPADAVVWEEVEARTADGASLSWSQLIFMAMAGIIAACGILLDSPILIVGAMVVSPDFGPVAGFCVGVVNRRFGLAWRSLLALAVGLPVAITVAFVFTVLGRASGLMPDEFTEASHNLADIISNPDAYSVIVAAAAGVVGVMSLTSAKSGALVGVLISVTTIPAAANIGVACAYGDWSSWRGSQLQLMLNVVSLLVAGVLTLLVQRRLYERRRRRHLAAKRPVTPSSPETTTPRASS
ncbi:MAG: DUF389 domain-containing protein [Solirubrobacteraceae bacterium]|nr:DUF389 domain-containing protein [Solirubrobacteraceae bacterium]